MTQTRALTYAGIALTALLVVTAGSRPAAQQPRPGAGGPPVGPAAARPPLAGRIVATNPAAFRPLTAVHGGAGNMAYAALLNRAAIGPHFNFLHRGEIPVGSGIGHHFHNMVEEMFVILNGEAQFTVNGRTALVKGPAAVVCRMGDSHAILNTGTEPLQWMNVQVSGVVGAGDAFDLGDTRVGAVVDAVPTFMSARFDPALLRPAATAGLRTRRLFTPTVFRSPWAGVDHVVLAPGSTTPVNTHEAVGEVYYVLGGSGTVTVGTETAVVQRWNAVPVRPGDSSSFTNTGSEPLELLVIAVARDAETKTAIVTGTVRP